MLNCTNSWLNCWKSCTIILHKRLKRNLGLHSYKRINHTTPGIKPFGRGKPYLSHVWLLDSLSGLVRYKLFWFSLFWSSQAACTSLKTPQKIRPDAHALTSGESEYDCANCTWSLPASWAWWEAASCRSYNNRGWRKQSWDKYRWAWELSLSGRATQTLTHGKLIFHFMWHILPYCFSFVTKMQLWTFDFVLQTEGKWRGPSGCWRSDMKRRSEGKSGRDEVDLGKERNEAMKKIKAKADEGREKVRKKY